MYFYIVLDNYNNIIFSPCLQVDKLFNKDAKYLFPSLPLSVLEEQLRGWTENKNTNKNKPEKIIAVLKSLLKNKQEDISFAFGWRDIQDEEVKSCGSVSSVTEIASKHYGKFRDITKGRQIAEKEIDILACALKVSREDIVHLMQLSVHKKEGILIPAIKKEKARWICQRCGEIELEEWPGLWGAVRTCPSCAAIGAVNSYQVIYRGFEQGKVSIHNSPVPTKNSNIPGKDEFELTKAQQNAAQHLKKWLVTTEVKEVLIWAACGAGKTEVSFSAVEEALKNKKRVVFAAPRQDVIRDIVPRFQKYFWQENIQVLSGFEPLNFKDCQLLIATTHQLLRFYNTFDLVVLDEMDAYPYSHSRVLKHGMAGALKTKGRIIYLTATPDDQSFNKIARKECTLIRLPARHHGYPVPVPSWLKITQRNQKGENKAAEHLAKLLTKGRLLLFVPQIGMVDVWVRKCRTWFKDLRVDGSHSRDPMRAFKVDCFLKQEYDLFISTMILERGITVDGVQVGVINADAPLFDTRALVQMAGRAGRTAANPAGEVLFLAEKNTRAMKQAIAWIQEQNKIAFQKGFLEAAEISKNFGKKS